MLPGLLCVVSNGQHSVTRIDRRLSFDWTDSLIESRVADVQSVTWSVQGYTRLWSGSYATPDSERYTLVPRTVKLSEDRRTAILQLQPLKPGFVYEIGVNESAAILESLWPTAGYYSMKVVPRDRFRIAE